MNNQDINKIKRDGIIKIDNFLTFQETKQISEIIKYYSVPKNDPKSFFPTSIKKSLVKILSFNFKKFYYSLKILDINKNKKLKLLADNFFGDESHLSYIDAYYSRISNDEILPWHTDQAYSGKLSVTKFNDPDKFFLKIFVYLSDVGPGNGCMSYVPGSHKIGYAIRKGIFNNQISYQPYWSLKNFKKIIEDNYSYFENYFRDKNILSDFNEKTKDIDKLDSDSSFSYEAKAGTAVIFDEGGIHRGSKPKLNDRMVLRYMYSRKIKD